MTILNSPPSLAWAAHPRADAPLTQSLPEQIAARLSERIVSGAYAPGQRIMEQAVAAEFETRTSMCVRAVPPHA